MLVKLLAVGADVQQSSIKCVDVILNDAASLPFADASFATVLCTQVLEHVEDPHRLLTEACRVLRPEGHLILTCPFIWALHERPHDYLRFSEYWLRKTLAEAGFAVEVLEAQGGDFATIGQLLLLTLDARRIHLPRIVQRIYNRFWAFLDRFVRHFDFLEGQWEKERNLAPTREEALLEIYKRARPG